MDNKPLESKHNYITPATSPLSGPIVVKRTINKLRTQVKQACVNCQKACKKCEDVRPCPRCKQYGIEETCKNGERKIRKKGISRGPYKHRAPNKVKPVNNDESDDQRHFIKNCESKLLAIKKEKITSPTLSNTDECQSNLVNEKKVAEDSGLFLLSAICSAALGDDDFKISPKQYVNKIRFKIPDNPSRTNTPPY